MFCNTCPNKKTCTQICPALETHLKEDEVYMREMLVSPKTLEWIAGQITEPNWYQRHPEYREKLKECLKKLPPEDRILLEMKFEGGMSNEAIGKANGMSEETIRLKIKGILSMLKKKIEKNSE